MILEGGDICTGSQRRDCDGQPDQRAHLKLVAVDRSEICQNACASSRVTSMYLCADDDIENTKNATSLKNIHTHTHTHTHT
jgi:hypothetical protein